ncbi:MAG: TonB C-terminal domain-containing protein [Myxococcota bacterium]
MRKLVWLGVAILSTACAPAARVPTQTAPKPEPPGPKPPATVATLTLPSWIENRLDGPARVTAYVVTIPHPLERPLTFDKLDESRWQFAEQRWSADEWIPQRSGARSLLAQLVAGFHNRLHPVFYDEYLKSLPASDPGPQTENALPAQDLHGRIRFELSSTGKLARIGIQRSSGDTQFDLAMLESLLLAAPLTAPPDVAPALENLAFEWEFHRDAAIGCTTYNLRTLLVDPVAGARCQRGCWSY